jgi:hypothetical protein
MRITRATLLKVAKDAAAQKLRSDRRLVCIYLTGSLLQEEPLIGGVTDIDLIVVHDSETKLGREVYRMTDEIHLDIAHLSQSAYHQPRHLRVDPWLGSFLCNSPICLHDIQHWFEFTQASVAAQFQQADNTLVRARSFGDAARQIWMDLHLGQIEGQVEQVSAFLKALELAGNSIAVLSGMPLTERRFMLNLPERAASIGRPGLSAGLVDLLLPEPLDENRWNAWLPGWKASLANASQVSGHPIRLEPCRHLYYERAAAAMLSEFPAAAAWIMLRTWTQAIRCLPESDSTRTEWGKAFQHLTHEEGLEKSLEALDAYLDSMEETLDSWASQNGVKQ